MDPCGTGHLDPEDPGAPTVQLDELAQDPRDDLALVGEVELDEVEGQAGDVEQRSDVRAVEQATHAARQLRPLGLGEGRDVDRFATRCRVLRHGRIRVGEEAGNNLRVGPSRSPGGPAGGGDAARRGPDAP